MNSTNWFLGSGLEGEGMADGDEVHANLPRRYLNNYRDVCAPAFVPEDVAHDIARVVRDDVKDFGNPPITFIAVCVETLSGQLPNEPLLRQGVDYGSLQQCINNAARQYLGNEQGMDLALRAVRSAIEEYRQGAGTPDVESVLGRYLMKIHEARFEKRVPLTSTHLNGLSSEEVDNRLNEIRSFAEREYAHLARSIARNPNVDRRIQRRRYNQGLGLYDGVR
jgi:hypothetical protein